MLVQKGLHACVCCVVTQYVVLVQMIHNWWDVVKAMVESIGSPKDVTQIHVYMEHHKHFTNAHSVSRRYHIRHSEQSVHVLV